VPWSALAIMLLEVRLREHPLPIRIHYTWIADTNVLYAGAAYPTARSHTVAYAVSTGKSLAFSASFGSACTMQHTSYQRSGASVTARFVSASIGICASAACNAHCNRAPSRPATLRWVVTRLVVSPRSELRSYNSYRRGP